MKYSVGRSSVSFPAPCKLWLQTDETPINKQPLREPIYDGLTVPVVLFMATTIFCICKPTQRKRNLWIIPTFSDDDDDDDGEKGYRFFPK